MGTVSNTKTSSVTTVIDRILNLVDVAKVMSRMSEAAETEKFRAIYKEAMKGRPSRNLSVQEAEDLIRPHESASDLLKSQVEESLRSCKP